MENRLIRERARDNLAGNWWLSVAVAFVAGILGGLVSSGSTYTYKFEELDLEELPRILRTYLSIIGGFGGIMGIVIFIIGGTVQLGYARYLLKQHDHANFEFNDLFSQFHRLGQGFAQSFLRLLFTFLWTLLLIIPGIIKSISYSMTPFIMAENPDLSANEAIRQSKLLMKGHKMDLFLLDLSFIGWGILSVLSLGIGFLFLTPYINAAYAAFYKEITTAPAEYI